MNHVSRETSLPPAPPEVHTGFGEQAPLLQRYAELLATTGLERGLIGPREVPRLWQRHLLNCAGVTELIPAAARIADVGSGAGLPGLVIAIRRPDLDVTLIDSKLRACEFLQETVDTLALTNVTVHRSRMEEVELPPFQAVTSRAVAELAQLIRWTWPLVAPGGSLLALKGGNVNAEIEAAQGLWRQWQLPPHRLHHVGVELVDPPTTVVELQRPTR